MNNGRSLLDSIASRQNLDAYQAENWEGSFEDYLDIVRRNPKVTRTAHQRMYDMVIGYGTYTVEDGKSDLTRTSSLMIRSTAATTRFTASHAR
jgi:serine protein kinase